MRLKHAILPAYLLCLLLVGGFIAYQFRGKVGASIPTVIALYEDSLATKITPSATSFTLVRGMDKQSRSLAGFYGFVVDENTPKEEFMTANCTATACTIVARGIDVQDGKTEVSGNKFEHARNASVKLTNFPQLAILSRILNGQESASSTFSFGDGTTGDNKTLFANNGSVNKPFLRYNETSDLWTFSDNGTDTIVLNTLTSGGLTASSSLGVIITDSKIGVNASSTGGMSFDSAGKLYFNGSVNVPMTVGFPAIFNDTVVFNGNVTTTGKLQVATPTADADAVNKGYADTLATTKYFGDHSDGVFSQSNGTTTWNTADKVVYNFTSFSLTGGALTFGSNLQNKRVIVYVDGDLTITSASSAAINLNGLGGTGGVGVSGSGNNGSATEMFTTSTSAGGAGGTSPGGATVGGGGGGGGGGMLTSGKKGGDGSPAGGGSAGSGSMHANFGEWNAEIVKNYLACGGGGGSGGATSNSPTPVGGNGGNGGGCIIFIVSGDINITSNMQAVGLPGLAGTDSGSNYLAGDGGGGGGGSFGIFYAGDVIANTATFTVTGGVGGAHAGGAGGYGGTGYAIVKKIYPGLFNVMF